MDLWRRSGNQTHWHLTLVGAANQVAGFYEFENIFGLDVALNTIIRACRGIAVTNFMLAKEEFWKNYTMDDFYRMA
jgi:hypothetical protein